MRTSKCKNKCYGQECLTKALFGTMLLLGLVTLQTSQAAVQPMAKVDEQLERAILAENWQKVVSMLPKDDEPNLPAPLRLVKGHACLATNRNNESLCLFLNTSSKKDLQEWRKWAESFATKYPARPIAYYFKGDSYARLEQWDDATPNFNTALKIDPNHPLVLNARGVAYTNQDEFARARVDFAGVVKYSKSFLADAYANIGALYIQRNVSPEGAVRAFSRALDISADFALALHGKGCVELILKKLEATKDLEKAIEKVKCIRAKGLMLENEVRYAAKVSGTDPEKLLAEAKQTGTTLHKRYEDLSASAERWETTGNALRGMSWLPSNQHLADFCGRRHVERMERIESKFGMDGVKNWYNKHSGLMGSSLRDIYRVGQFNDRIQPTEKIIKGTGNVVGFGGDATALGALATGAGSPFALVAGGIGISGHATAAAADQALDWSKTHSAFRDRIENNFGHPSGAAVGRIDSLTRNAGGVDISLSEINWDEGDWPFKEYYGIGYGLVKNKEITSSQERRAADAKSK